MKKGILLVLAALLIAGLFVSCNSDVATNKSGSEKDIAYISFDNSGAKVLSTSTVMPDVPDVDDLDWYFKATKNNGIIRTGEVKTWTCINTDGGLSGTIGPFAVGNWAFELVAVNHGATAPSTETYYDNGDWHYGSQVVYVGRNASVELEAANTSSAPKLIAIELERVNVPTTTEFKVNASSIKLLDSESDSFDSGNVYYTLVIGKGTNTVGVKEKTAVSVTANTTAYVPSGSYDYTPTTDGEIVEITLNLYESNDENAQVVKSATTSVAAFKGSVITITGSSDQIDAFATFDGNYEASVTTLNGLGNTTFYASFADAINHAPSDSVVKVLKDVTLENDSTFTIEGTTIAKNLFIDGGNNTITASSDSSKDHLFLFSDFNTTPEESAVCNWTIKDLIIIAPGYRRVILVNGEAQNTILLENVQISSNGENFYCNGPSVGTVRNCSFSFVGESYPTYESNDDVYHSAVIVGYGGTIVLEDSTIVSSKHGLATFPTGSSITATGSTKVTAAEYAIWSRCDKGYIYWSASNSEIIINTTNSIDGKIKVTEPVVANDHRASIKLISGDFRNIGSFTVEDSTGTYSTDDNKAIVISGGTFDVNPYDYLAPGYQAVENEGTWTVSKITDGVASVERNGNEIQFATLQGAIDYAVSGETVKIRKNINLESTTDSGFVLTIDKSITVDGDNNALTIDRSGNPRVAYGLLIGSENTSSSDDVNVTMQNLTLTFKGCKYGLIAEDDGTGNETVILKDMVITSDEGAPVVVGDSVVLKGQTSIQNNKVLNVPSDFYASDTIGGEGAAGGYTHFYTGVGVWGGGSLTVESGVSISGPVGIEIMSSGGTVTVKDGATVTGIGNNTNGFTEDNYMFGNALYCDNHGVMLVQGGTFTVELDQTTNYQGLKVAGTGEDIGSISITGGVFNMKMDPNTFVASGYHAIEDPSGTWTVSAE